MYKNLEQLAFDVAELVKRDQGSTDEYNLDQFIELDDPDITPKSNLKGHLTIMSIESEFNVQLRDIEIEVEQTCSKCAKNYTQKVQIPFVEKQYTIDRSSTDERPDLGIVDLKNHSIDISDFLRQEIILHFPLIPVCSTHCQGINL
ncbi:DUF177 domain-containing protein [Candidatus Peregrinibacteria bacterium]|nr:DUF177 domain-containing protein [Candidatus Peregrinibacteria bacterium]MBT4148010.1 DUF177 domain-containing protein [Candidatus Peregrinibacteria bacterium]MBT4366749.1 DUF177 domain-containing protein [Candidatus Peregrinibacteria bacterium]MBT4456328.1 DUF177 domain-containing protein [Candidatus Peregrinibacteria bacterium]